MTNTEASLRADLESVLARMTRNRDTYRGSCLDSKDPEVRSVMFAKLGTTSYWCKELSALLDKHPDPGPPSV